MVFATPLPGILGQNFGDVNAQFGGDSTWFNHPKWEVSSSELANWGIYLSIVQNKVSSAELGNKWDLHNNVTWCGRILMKENRNCCQHILKKRIYHPTSATTFNHQKPLGRLQPRALTRPSNCLANRLPSHRSNRGTTPATSRGWTEPSFLRKIQLTLW